MPRKQRVPRAPEPVDSDSDLDRSLYQPLTEPGEGGVNGSSLTWAGKRACVIVAVIVTGIIAAAVVTWQVTPVHNRANVYACRQTYLWPSELGCPATSECRSRRPELSNTTDFHRADIGWDYPLLGYHNAHRVEAMSQEDVWDIFRLPARIVTTYLFLEDRLERSVSVHLRDKHQVREKLPKDIFVPIAHICCLTKEELSRVKPAVHKWTSGRNFSTHLDFTHVECWQESETNVENSLVADLTSQKHLHKLNKELTTQLLRHNVPIIIRRPEQMKYRIPLVGFYTRHAVTSIRPMLAPIAAAIDDVNRAFELNMQITDKPTVAYGKEMNIDGHSHVSRHLRGKQFGA